MNSIRLEVFKHLFASLAEEMGVALRKASYSPNIKERRDFSCALFDPAGRMVAQAAHIPVHLGSLPLSVAAAIEAFSGSEAPGGDDAPGGGMASGGGLAPGDGILLNDPFRGGTHLPDITLVTPVFVGAERVGFVASRAHHADVGGMTPGSMPVASEIYQEGLIIPPVRLLQGEQVQRGVWDLILANVRTPNERAGDLWAQIAANRRGAARLAELVRRYGNDEVQTQMAGLLAYGERLTRALLAGLPAGEYRFVDYLDDDGKTGEPVRIQAAVTIRGDQAVVDFSGSSPQRPGSVNAVYAITLSAVNYVVRCLLGLDAPNNAGCLAPVQVIAPPGTVVNALPPAPVAGGNVETSQRIVDVLLGALAPALPGKIPAASQGTMNNLTIGGFDARHGRPFAYYETLAGGMGARPGADGVPARHSHMTNTLNTPVEALEYAYPLQVVRYAVRRGSGGAGRWRGGDGLVREVRLLADCQATLLSERRRFAPYGLDGGETGRCGENVLLRDGEETSLPGKGTFELKAGDVLSIRTPGGGGVGEPEKL